MGRDRVISLRRSANGRFDSLIGTKGFGELERSLDGLGVARRGDRGDLRADVVGASDEGPALLKSLVPR